MHTCTHCEREVLRRDKNVKRIKDRIAQLQVELKAICNEFGHDIEVTSVKHDEISGSRIEYFLRPLVDCDHVHACNCPTQRDARSIPIYQRSLVSTKKCKRCEATIETQKRRIG